MRGQSRRGEWNLSEDVLDICPHLLSLRASEEAIDELQWALAIAQQLVQISGTQYPSTFVEWMPLLVDCTRHSNAEIRGSALTCLAAFVRELGEAHIPSLPTVSIHPSAKSHPFTLSPCHS